MISRLARVFIGFFLLLVSFGAAGQDFPMLHFNVDDGLPSNVVYQVYRDSKGYLWIATDKGIARYNGIKFEVFTTSNGLPDNEIFFFQEDNYGRLWLGTFNGERCFYKDGVFHNEANTPFLRLPVGTSHTIYIKNEKDSSVTLFYSFTMVNYDNEKKWLANRRTDANSVFYQKIAKDKYNVYGTHFSLTIDTFRHEYNKKNTTPAFEKIYVCQNDYYLQYGRKVYSEQMEFLTEIPEKLLNGDIYLNSFGILGSDTLYLTKDGLYVNSNLHVLPGESVSSVTVDGDHNYWISTLKNGIYVLPSYYSRARSHKHVFSGSIEYTRAINGAVYYIIENRIFDLHNGVPQLRLDFGKDALLDAFLIDDTGHCYRMSAAVINTVDNVKYPSPRVRSYKTGSYSPKEIFVEDNILHARTVRGLTGFDLNGGDTLSPLFYTGNDEQRTCALVKVPKGGYWYSTAKGVYELAKDYTSKEMPALRNVAFKQFAFIGDYLVGYTQRNALLICSDVYNNFQAQEVKDHNCIWDKFYRLDDHHLLISTSNKYRLLTVDSRPGHRSFNVSVIEDPFIPLQVESICSDSSNCYFFKDGTITTIPLSSLFKTQTPPRLSFTSLKAGRETYFIDSAVNLSYAGSRNLSINFSTISFSGKDIFYQYSISKNGVDNWRNLEGEQINLVNIGSGGYTVKVRARTNSGKFGAPVMFRLHIALPFWFTWWFISLSVCVVLAFAFWVARKRTALALSKKQKEHDTQVRFMKSEYKALNALMNPHFIFNTLNNVQSLVNSNDKLAANEYLRVFADLIRQNMHNISKELIPLSKEMELVSNYLLLEKLRFEDRLCYDISVEDDLHLAEVMVPPLIFQPLVENAIKHGVLQLAAQDGHIRIRVYEKGDLLYLQVKDNGVGFNKSLVSKDPAHESYGLENIRKRIQHLSIIQNKQISLHIGEEVNSEDGGKWTVASISIPC